MRHSNIANPGTLTEALYDLLITIELEGLFPKQFAELRTLAGTVPWTVNTMESPAAIISAEKRIAVGGGNAEFELPPFTAARMRFPR